MCSPVKQLIACLSCDVLCTNSSGQGPPQHRHDFKGEWHAPLGPPEAAALPPLEPCCPRTTRLPWNTPSHAMSNQVKSNQQESSQGRLT